ncbi:MAG: hypothetical protein KA981_02150 [Bacteroidia bacterium]|jgi:hypothetical protein|nr:hypothetical protein [Bacteroidia bacterium]
MKQVKLIIFGFALLFFASCTKTDTLEKAPGGNTNNPSGGGGGTNNPTYFFTCKVNGVFTDFQAMTLIKDDPSNIKQFYLIGQRTDKELPSLTYTLNFKGPGWVDGLSYALDEHDLVNLAEFKAPNLNLFKSTATPSSATSGMKLMFDKIVMTGSAPYASGTFSGTLQLEENMNTVVITEGKFKVQFLN